MPVRARLIPPLVLIGLPLLESAVASEPADLVFVDGAVYTVDAARSWAEAVAVRDGRIVYVGNEAGARAYIGEGTRRVDLDGRMLLPGFQDAHIHPVSGGVNSLDCALYELPADREAYLAEITDCARRRPDAAWIRGGGWLLDAFLPSGLPSKQALDAIEAKRPVALVSADGHTLWVNSSALAAAGITAATPDPPKGRIDRDPATGAPSGSLQESAMDLVRAAQPAYSPAEKQAGLRYALEMLNGYGVTSIQDASVHLGGDREAYRSLEVYRALEEAGELSLRVVAALWLEQQAPFEPQLEQMLAAREANDTGRLRPISVKIMLDGIVETHTAAMLEDYLDHPGDRGEVTIDRGPLQQIVTRLDAERFQVHIHAIGDAAVRYSLDAFEAAIAANGRSDNRHHICHLQFVDPADVPRFRELRVVANFQPLWALADKYVTELAIPRVAPKIRDWIYPIGSLMQSGAVVAFGSDWSVSSANPLEQIEVAVTRKAHDGSIDEVFLPEQRITLAEAIAAFTIGAAYVNHQEETTGSIEVGKLADLIVLDRNLFAIPTASISDAKVLLTLLDGEVVHGDLAL